MNTTPCWVRRTLQSPECREALLAACESPDKQLRRLAYGLAVEAPEGGNPHLLAQALRDPEPAIRVWAARQVGLFRADPWAQALAHRALGDRSVQVRRVALDVLAKSLPAEQLMTLAEKGLLDESTTARWQARILRLQLGPIDLGVFYRQALTRAEGGKSLRGALLGLGESGTREDIAALSPYLDGTKVSVRRAAIRALAGLEARSTTEPFMAALRDPQAGISREGRRALEARVDQVPFRELAELIGSADAFSHARRNALSVANRRSKWESLPLLLEGIGAKDPIVAQRATTFMNSWEGRYNRNFLLPTHQQLDGIDKIFQRVECQLEPRQRQSLAFLLRSARGFAAN